MSICHGDGDAEADERTSSKVNDVARTDELTYPIEGEAVVLVEMVFDGVLAFSVVPKEVAAGRLSVADGDDQTQVVPSTATNLVEER